MKMWTAATTRTTNNFESDKGTIFPRKDENIPNTLECPALRISLSSCFFIFIVHVLSETNENKQK